MKLSIQLLAFILFTSGRLLFGIDDDDFEYYTIVDGLSQSSITCVFNDSEGYLWVGTQDGLNLYDGYEFEIFRKQPYDTTSISNNSIFTIYEDSKGIIWIGTQNGLNKFNKRTRSFTSYLVNTDGSSNPDNNTIYAIHETTDGTLWLKTLDSFLSFNPENRTYNSLRLFNDPSTLVQGTNNFAIIEQDTNKLWVGTKDGLYFVDLKTVEVTRYTHSSRDPQSLSDDKVRALYLDDKNNLWIGTSDGLNMFNTGENSFTRYYLSESKEFNLSNTINFIYPFDSLNLVIGTTHGLGTFNRKTKTITQQWVFSDNQQAYRNDYFSSIVIDQADIMWLGTYRGLIKKDLKPKKFKLINEDNNPIPGVTSYDIASIYVDDEENLWLGTWGDGLNIISPHGKVTTYTSTNSYRARRIRNDFVHVLHQDNTGKLWMGSQNGLSVYNNRQFVDVCRIYPWLACDAFDEHIIYELFNFSEEEHWVASNHGLIIIDTKKKHLERHNRFLYNNKPIIFGSVYSIKRDDAGMIWLGTDNGLLKLTEELTVEDHYYHNAEHETNRISGNNIYSLLNTKDGTLWAGTGSGLNMFQKDKNQFRVYSERDGLPNNLIYEMHEDRKGHLWISTNRGLAQFLPEEQRFYSYDLHDGLQNYEYNLGASFETKDGKLYFGGISGLNVFYPDSIELNTHKPKAVITAIEEVNQQGVRPLVPSPENVVHINSRSLLNIRFSALDFTLPEKNLYKYKILQNGNEQQWIELGNKHEATFHGLDPGTYKLIISGSNNDQVWNEDEPAVINIEVSTPVWESPLAYVVYTLIVVLLIYIFFRYRTRTLRQLNKEYKERERISRQVAKQKEELTLKNKNITDSINYAKRIQEAMMPSKSLFKKYIPESFVLHMPKDIVSGDFYWIHKKGDKTFVAAVDCTGHGVPGAFMSIIGFELFRKITNIQGIEEPASILNTLNEDFAEVFKDVTDFTLRDGMDIAFCVIDKKNKQLEYAGAFNPLYLIRDNKISELKGDRFSVGIETSEVIDAPRKFKNHLVQLEDDDIIFIFSDGYADQFGGPEGKKYKYRRFRHLLLTVHKLPMDLQHDLLKKSILDWKDELDQVDDILVIGFKPCK